jgi:hypothetical protein
MLDAIPSIRTEMRTISHYAHHTIPSTCDLLTSCLTAENLSQSPIQARVDQWLDEATKSREEVCHEAAARLVGRTSELRDCTLEVKKSVIRKRWLLTIRLIVQLKSSRTNLKRSAALSLGKIKYSKIEGVVGGSVEALLGQLESGQVSLRPRLR